MVLQVEQTLLVRRVCSSKKGLHKGLLSQVSLSFILKDFLNK